MTRLSAPWRSTTNTMSRLPPSPLTLSVALLSAASSNVSGYALCPPSRTKTNPKLMAEIGGGRGWRVRCMANQRRVKMVAKQIQRELSDMLITDKVLQYAVLPEASLGADRYLSSLTTISGVEVSSDLQVVKVYVSVFGDDRGKEVAIAGLKSKVKYVRSELGRRMKLRLTPEIRFIEDESLERGSRVIAILDRLKEEKNTRDQDVKQLEPPNSSEEDGEGDMDNEDEDIIYVN
ncbi:putative ribosome-binding factor A, chloroplastic [Curcuma longa]|uniref:putative ribosome-binding factor A, chloroplastic n=1 Tax=Curcuma longa TaxID=136217 RepID=UPI003D9E029C